MEERAELLSGGPTNQSNLRDGLFSLLPPEVFFRAEAHTDQQLCEPWSNTAGEEEVFPVHGNKDAGGGAVTLFSPGPQRVKPPSSQQNGSSRGER